MYGVCVYVCVFLYMCVYVSTVDIIALNVHTDLGGAHSRKAQMGNPVSWWQQHSLLPWHAQYVVLPWYAQYVVLVVRFVTVTVHVVAIALGNHCIMNHHYHAG